MLQVFIWLDAPVLRPLVVDRPRRVEERHVAILAGTKIDFLQLQFVSRMKVLFWIPKDSAVKDLTWKDGKAPTRLDLEVKEIDASKAERT